MAEIVFREIATARHFGDRVAVSSAGTGDWHVGEHADRRTVEALAKRGYDGSAHRARQFENERFITSDLVVALDRSHERILREWAPTEADAEKVVLLRAFDPRAGEQLDVPDPYYAGPEMFDEVLGMIEDASRALFRQLEPAIRSAV